MAGISHQSQPQLMKKPVPVKPKITLPTVYGQGSSGPTRRSTSSQGPSQSPVQGSSARHRGPNGWRAPRKESSGDVGKWMEATAEVDDDDKDKEKEDEEEEEERSSKWRRRRKSEASSGRGQTWRPVPKKDMAGRREWPKAKKESSSSEDDEELGCRSAALPKDEDQILRNPPVDCQKRSRSFLHDDDSEIPRPAPGDSGYSSSSNSFSSCPMERKSAKSLDYELSRRLGVIRLDKDLTKQNAVLVNKIHECILQHLKRKNHHAGWTKCPQGSYYEKVKIKLPDEYDCMMTCEIRCLKDYHPNTTVQSKSYCTLKLKAMCTGVPHLSHREIQGTTNEEGFTFLSPKKFRIEFERNVREALAKPSLLSTDYKIEVRPHNGSSPAVTLDVRNDRGRGGTGKEGMGEIQFSMDLVPAIRFLEWPKPAKNWRLPRLPEVEHHLKEEDHERYPCAVAKIHPSEYTKGADESRLWRISFSATEKFLILHADGLRSDTQTCRKSCRKTCRKDVLRLLKMDLVDLKQQNQQRRKASSGDGSDNDDFGLSSFYLKTIFLLLINPQQRTTNFCDLSDDSNWSKRNLRERYVDALKMVIHNVTVNYIAHYFIEDENLLSLQDISASDQKHIIAHFQRICDHYS